MGYREEVLRTARCPGNDEANTQMITMAALGLAGETGEVVEFVKKYVYHDRPFDSNKLIEELGDVRWYMELLMACAGITMEEVEARNVAKLRARYPDGFTPGGGIR